MFTAVKRRKESTTHTDGGALGSSENGTLCIRSIPVIPRSHRFMYPARTENITIGAGIKRAARHDTKQTTTEKQTPHRARCRSMVHDAGNERLPSLAHDVTVPLSHHNFTPRRILLIPLSSDLQVPIKPFLPFCCQCFGIPVALQLNSPGPFSV